MKTNKQSIIIAVIVVGIIAILIGIQAINNNEGQLTPEQEAFNAEQGTPGINYEFTGPNLGIDTPENNVESLFQ